jgi:hypothetical protein
MHRIFSSGAAALALGATLVAGGDARADTVIPDDLIVQGSACVGLDCLDGESFGFDTLRLKENNTRIVFFDTSTSPGFPNNHWQLTANDSASGGLNKFSVENLTVATVPFTIVGAAPTNSVFVADNGKVGFRTATPLLDLHVTTGDTPAHRFEQTTSSGFSAQTWDIGANEANFFVRDLTGGSRLPLRIRPGAPTSSLDINASGNVGVGTASPVKLVHMSGTASTLRLQDTSAASNISEFTVTNDFVVLGANRDNTTGAIFNAGKTAASVTMRAAAGDSFVQFGTTPTNNTDSIVRMRIDKDGNVGIGTTAPAARLHTTGTVRLAGITGCSGGLQTDGAGNVTCLLSSRQFKNITGDLPPRTALANVMALRPQVGSYKETPEVSEHWLIAEEVAAVDPALVGLKDGKPYTVKHQNVVADLIVVVQQQQRRIDELERRLAAK